VAVQTDFIISRHQRVIRVFRGFLDRLAGKIDKDFRIGPANALDPQRRNQNFLTTTALQIENRRMRFLPASQRAASAFW
jgi:hypothetical protein